MLSQVLGAVFGIAALALVYQQARRYSLAEILAGLDLLTPTRLALATLATVACYAVLTVYDFMGFRYHGQGRPISRLRIIWASFVSFAFHHSFGTGHVLATILRFRMYSRWGVSRLQIAKIVAVFLTGSWIGFFCLTGFSFLAFPMQLPANIGSTLPSWAANTRVIGLSFVLFSAGYLAWAAFWRKPLRVWKWNFAAPSFGFALLQIAIATFDFGLSGFALYCLLPPIAGLGYFEFMSIYLLAQIVAMVSHAPGGIGVLDSMIILFLRDRVEPPLVIGALLSFRVLFYAVPLAFGAALLALFEVRFRPGASDFGTAIANGSPQGVASHDRKNESFAKTY